MTPALYARYSTDLQNAASIEDQVRAGQRIAAGRGWGPAEVFTDAGISGASMANRPGLQAMLAAVAEGRVCAVIAEALDRLSRDQADIALIHRACAGAGVPIVTQAEGEIGDDAAGLMQVGLRGVMNAMYLKDLAVKTRRGLEGVVISGRHAGPPPYGYRLKPGGAPGELEIDEAEAEVVRRIWSDFAAGLSPRAIARALNAEGVAGPRGAPWRITTIFGQPRRGNGVLHNPLYTGERVWNRHRKVKDPATGKAKMKARPESEWIRRPAPELAIVPDDLACAAAAERARRAKSGSGRPEAARRVSRPLSGLLKCGACGGSMTIIGGAARRYGCAAQRDTGECDSRLTVRADEAEARVFAALKQRLMSPAAIKLAVDAYRAERARLARQGGAERRRLEKRIADLKRREDRILEAWLAEDAPSSALAKAKEHEAERAELETRLAAMSPAPAVELHPNAGASYAAEIERLESILAGGDPAEAADRARAIDAVRALVTLITGTKNEKSGETGLRGEGDLAALMTLSEEGYTAMGAGARTPCNIHPVPVTFAA